MQKWIVILLCIVPGSIVASTQQIEKFFLHLNELDFEGARQMAAREQDESLRFEMQQLTDILFYEGQVDKAGFKLSETSEKDNLELYVLKELNSGYVSLFYDQIKGNAYKHFYKAYQVAKKSEATYLIKPCLFAILKYYNFEIVQINEAYLPYLKHLESLQSDEADRIWITIYKMIFYSKTLGKPDQQYFELSKTLDELESNINSDNLLLAYIYREKGLQFELQKNFPDAIQVYKKAIYQSKDYPFLRDIRFFVFLKLTRIATEGNDFRLARHYLDEAKRDSDKADTLRSNYRLNIYSFFLFRAEKKYDSAVSSLWNAYQQDFQLDFKGNTLEINRLNVELETQEKENANLILRQNRIWLMVALGGVVLLFVASYSAYANQRSKNRMQEKEKEMQTMKMEKLLKDQEIFGIDAMIEGQEKERQKIAADLHDNLGSLLATLKFNFQGLIKKKDVMESDRELLLQKTDGLLEEAYQRVRGIAHARNAGVNAKDGLLPAIRNFVSKVSVFNQLTIDVEEHGMNERLDNSLEIMIFRMIQELITNVIKHARATDVVVHLTKHEDAINLMVEDNGVGFDISQIKSEETMGLYSIQKKIENLGGRVSIDSILAKGTTIIIDIPLT